MWRARTAFVPAHHILIPIHDFSAGGTELIAFRLARQWLAEGRRVSILAGASDGPLRPRVPEGVEVHVLSPERPRSSTSRIHLGRQMAPFAAQLEPDAIFIPGNFHFGLAKALKRALPNAGIVAKASNPIWTNGAIPVPRFIARMAVSAVTRGIDQVIAMAPALRTDVTRYVNPMRVTVIPDPFLDDAVRFTARPRKPARPKQTLRILTVGRLEAQKDPMLALAVLADLRQFEHDVSLTLLGAGPMDVQLQAEIDRLGLRQSVTLAGYAADPRPYYQEANLLLMTSEFEGVPAVIGEALSHGLPFVATDCSNWLTTLALEHPALGTVTPDRVPGVLAEALLQKAARPYPTAQQIDAGIGLHRIGRSAQLYLELFDRLT
jgi:glycosyltransferase involved in cell wall biosynthesis